MTGIILNCIAFIIYLILSIYLLSQDRKSAANVVFSIICLIYAVWSFSFIFINSPLISETEKNIWMHIGYSAAYLYNPLLVIFSLLFTGYYNKIRCKFIFLVILFILTGLYQYMHWAHNAIINDMPTGFWYYSSHIYANLYNFVSLAIAIIGAARSGSNRLKSQVKIISAGAVIAIVITLFEDFYSAFIGAPTLTPVLIIFWVGSVWLAFVKHRFLGFNEELVSRIVFNSIDEIIILVDPQFKIETANEKFSDVMNLSVINIKGESIFSIIENADLRKNLEKITAQDKSDISFKLNFSPKKKTGRLFDIKLQLIFDKYKDLLGILIIGREIKSLEKLKEVHNISDRETDIIRFVLTGSTNSQIASSLDITERTVKSHITHIYNKLGIYNKVQLLNAILDL